MGVPEELKNPSIYLGELRIDEPITMLTDILVAIVCAYAFFQLRKRKTEGKVYNYLKYFFLLMSISTLAGGLMGHGFNYALNIYWKLPYWVVSMFAVMLAERAAILFASEQIGTGYAKFFRILNIVELIAFMIISFYTLDFIFVVAHSAYGLLLVVGAFMGYLYYKTNNRGALYFLYGVGVSTIGAVVFLTQFNFGHWCNHMDISHILMAMSGWLFYKGGKVMLYPKEE